MYTPLHRIPSKRSGHLYTMARPRGGDWLLDEMKHLKRHGIDLVVSALEWHEAHTLGLSCYAEMLSDLNIDFIEFPIPDRGVPSFLSYRRLVVEIAGLLNADSRVVCHCRMGVGRASLLAAGVLRTEGVGTEAAFERIGAARGLSVPDTRDQLRWLRQVEIPTVALRQST